MDTSGNQVSALDDIELYWENGQLDVDTVCRQKIDSPFFSTALDDLKMGGSARNPILLDNEEDKENSSLTTPVFEKRTRPNVLLRSRLFGTTFENVPDYGYRMFIQ